MHKPTYAVAVNQVNAAFLIGRLIVGGFYLYAGIDNLLHLNQQVGYAAFKGVPLPLLSIIVASILLLVGGMSILTGYRPVIGVGAVILFLIPVTLLMHNFWTIADPQMRMIEMHAFQGNVALIGSALVLLGVPQPWVWSVDNMAVNVKTNAAEMM
jgi:putative oxidoreductase